MLSRAGLAAPPVASTTVAGAATTVSGPGASTTAAGATSNVPAAAQTVKLGASLCLSGPGAGNGEGMKKGVDLGAERLNEVFADSGVTNPQSLWEFF